MYKKHKVILLPTEDHSKIWSHKGRRLYYNQANMNDIDDEIRYHLYIISDEEIKGGDYCYSEKYRDVDIVTANPVNVNNSEGYFKVIAGTNKTFKTPQIPEDFIKQYCNKNGIDEVEVEYKYIGNEFVTKKDGYALKISPDNKISIKQLKDNYSREEVEELLENYIKDNFKPNSTITESILKEKVENWIKENL